MLIRIILLVVLLDTLMLITAFPHNERVINTDTITDQVALPIGDLK